MQAAAASAAPAAARWVASTRETTPAMLARVTAALDDRLGVAERVAAHLLRGRRNSRAVDG
jgi:hypothetical protein